MTVTPPPKFQAGFSPVILTCVGSIGEEASVTISNKDTAIGYTVTLIATTQRFNLAAYVQSLFEGDAQEVAYELSVNGKSFGKFYAIRSAAQVGECSDLERYCGQLLTDFTTLNVWSGYPREVAVLAKDGYYAQLSKGAGKENISLSDGIANIPISCECANIRIYSNAAAWSEYCCVAVENAYVYTIHLDERTAKLSGELTLTVEKTDSSTYQLVKAYSGYGDVTFEIPLSDTITGAGMTAIGSIDTASIQVLGSTRPLFERSSSEETVALPATVALLPDGSRISKNSSSMLHVIVNQPL